VYLGKGLDGKPLRPSFFGTTEAEALQAYKDWLKDSGNVPIERVCTVGEWAVKWLEIYKKGEVAYKSYKNYELYVTKHIILEIGALKFSDVKQAHIRMLYKKKQSLSASALKHINISLNGIFETAKDNHLCTENPAAKVKPPDKPKKTPVSFSLREIELIFKFAPLHKSGNLVLALLHTALRSGEICALVWPNVNVEENYIDICRTVAEVENPNPETIVVGGKEKHRKKYDIKEIPKGGHTRLVALTPDATEFFKNLPNYNKGLYVFPSLSGNFMTPNQFREQYEQFFKALNKWLDNKRAEYLKAHPGAPHEALEQFEHVRTLSPHKCRHTYATHAIRRGINMRVVQEQLGHRQITTTEIYTNINIDDRKNNIVNLKY
jgi:integrase